MARPLKIFVSYSRDDPSGSDWAEKLDCWLEHEGFDVWRDVSRLYAGERWVPEIHRQIAECDVFLAVISAHYLESYVCKAEYVFAFEKPGRVLPVLVDETVRELPFLFRPIQHLNLSESNSRSTLLKCLERFGSVPRGPPWKQAPWRQLTNVNQEDRAERIVSQPAETDAALRESAARRRIEASSSAKRIVLERFECECAACGQASELTADVAHLYEDATTHPPEPDRLIVLCSNCNQAEERAKSRSKPPLLELFSPGMVAERARQRYRLGRYGCAYQGHRLAAYLFERQGSYSRAVECLVEAISSLRPVRWGDFLKATLLEIERLCCLHEVFPVQRWLCVDRFALVLYDYRRWNESADVQSASVILRAELGSDSYPKDEQKFDSANSFRREALIKACTVLQFGSRPLAMLLGRLLEDAKEFERLKYFDAFATNLDVAGKLSLKVGGNIEVAHKYSLRALDKAHKITHKWVLQEHYWRETEYYLEKHDGDNKRRNMFEALRIFRDHPVVLEPTLGAAGPVPHDPIKEIERYGVTAEELREHGVFPSRNPPPEVPLQLNEAQIYQLVRNIGGK
ncbi:hypothetical protein SBA4_1360018 [Candidatus Sulfopaludibacter sp. SbA4]|nr:hypothetical protein SBA4_1360018 [Candidatus Sulfopaludibacter sp. SbA4]